MNRLSPKRLPKRSQADRSKLFRAIWELALLSFSVSALIYLVRTEIPVKEDIIPTIINGLVSSVSVIVGFTGILITFAYSNKLIDLSHRESRYRLIIIVALLTLSLTFLWTMYMTIIVGGFYLAFKLAMVALLLAVGAMVDFMMTVVVREIFKKDLEARA